METSSKEELAQAFLEELGHMPAERLQQLIRDVVGEQLAGMMFNYAQQVLTAAPERVLENASSLLILGYLIRAHEQGGIPPETPPV